MRNQIKNTQTHEAALKMLRDPYYRELRGWHFNLGAKEAMKTVKALDALYAQIAKVHPQRKLFKEVEEAND